MIKKQWLLHFWFYVTQTRCQIMESFANNRLPYATTTWTPNAIPFNPVHCPQSYFKLFVETNIDRHLRLLCYIIKLINLNMNFKLNIRHPEKKLVHLIATQKLWSRIYETHSIMWICVEKWVTQSQYRINSYPGDKCFVIRTKGCFQLDWKWSKALRIQAHIKITRGWMWKKEDKEKHEWIEYLYPWVLHTHTQKQVLFNTELCCVWFGLVWYYSKFVEIDSNRNSDDATRNKCHFCTLFGSILQYAWWQIHKKYIDIFRWWIIIAILTIHFACDFFSSQQWDGLFSWPMIRYDSVNFNIANHFIGELISIIGMKTTIKLTHK